MSFSGVDVFWHPDHDTICVNGMQGLVCYEKHRVIESMDVDGDEILIRCFGGKHSNAAWCEIAFDRTAAGSGEIYLTEEGAAALLSVWAAYPPPGTVRGWEARQNINEPFSLAQHENGQQFVDIEYWFDSDEDGEGGAYSLADFPWYPSGFTVVTEGV